MADHLNVLILEDNNADAALIAKELERAGYDFDWARVKTREEYANALENRPDLILSDFSLPQFDALEALKILNKNKFEIPLIVVTGSPSEETAVLCIKAGAADYLSKERLSHLGKAVQQALAEKKLREDNQGAAQGFGEGEIKRRGQKELETIVTVNIALRAAPDRASMLPVIAGLLQDIADVQGIAIALKHPASGDISVEMAGGAWKEWQDQQLIPEEEISEASLNGAFFTCEDINSSPRVKQVSIFNDLTAVACFPLISQDQSIGILWIGCKQPFSEDRLDLIQAIANIAANALHRTTLHENNLRALQESRAIAEIARSLNENLDLDNIFQLIVDASTAIIPNSTRAVVHLFDEIKKSLHAVAVSPVEEGGDQESGFPKIRVTSSGEFDFGNLEDTESNAAALRSGYGIAGIVIEKGETVNVRDATTDDRYLQANHISDIRSMIVAPILNTGRRLGTISVLSNKPNTFSATDEDLLNNLSIQAATAMENARLLEAEYLQRELAESQAEITALINQTLELEALLNQILEHTLRIFSFRAANIVLVQGEDLRIAGHKGYQVGDEVMQRYNTRVADLPEGDLHRVICESREKVVVQDTKTDPRWTPANSFDWVRSYAGLPLIAGDEIIGILSVDGDKAGFMTEGTLRRLEIFAADAAAAVHNARLYTELESALETEKETRQKLILADKLTGMGRMVASVAHELNNPLQTIKNCLFLLEQGFTQQDDAETLELATSEVKRLSGIVDRLREVYRPRAEEHFEPTEISPVLAEVAKLMDTHLRRNKVALEMELSHSTIAVVEGFPDKLKQVFINLYLNAIEAMRPDGGTLTVSTSLSKDDKEVGVSFSDSGPGISEEAMSVIFDPFYSTKETGMGLGLTICYDITENHNGRIAVMNNPDKGATFTVWLPLSDVRK